MTTPILEVIVTSVTDAVQARLGGAHRLEVVRNLECGGLTPSLELVRAIQDAVDLPLRVMLRDSTGYGVADEMEVASLMHSAVKLHYLKVDGVVTGFLKEQIIDTELTARILAATPNLKATFHHAFEDSEDKIEALRQLKLLPQIDHVLCHGGPGDLGERAKRLADYAQAAGSELKIIAGGGIDHRAISLLRSNPMLREFHVGRAAREGYQVQGAVRSELVQRLVQAIS